MGTNYYVKEERCACCRRKKEQLHIGEKSLGWSFLFHATDEIMTCEDWKIELSTKTIVDEYGEEVKFEALFDMIRRTKDERNHTLYCREHHPEHADVSCFLDPEGYSFSRATFS